MHSLIRRSQKAVPPARVPRANLDAAPTRTLAYPPGVTQGKACACGGGCPRCRARAAQPKLTVGAPDDVYEREAERIATNLLADAPPTAAASTVCAPPVSGGVAQRAATTPAPLITDTTAEDAARALGGGRPLDAATRGFFEPRLHHDFSRVRVHTGSQAAQSAQALSARAYTLGRDIVFGAGEYAPQSHAGRHLLAHELVHVVQQQRSPALRRRIQRATMADLKAGLEAMSADHKTVVDDLFQHPKFVPLMNFLSGCPAGILEFEAARKTTKVNGKDVDVFGGVSQGSGGGPATLTVNPKIQASIDNPLEMVDTVVHEFIHAALRFRADCESQANPFPLDAAITDMPRDPELVDVRIEAVGAGIRADDRRLVKDAAAKNVKTRSGGDPVEYYERNYGPAGSRPKTNYGDLKRPGLELITAIAADIHQAHPKIGKEPLSFDNVELMQAGDLLSARAWWNATQREYSMQLHKDRVARKRGIDPKTFTDRDYDMSAIQVVEFAEARSFDSNADGEWGPVGGVWSCKRRSRYTGEMLHTYVTGTRGKPPGGVVDYKIVQHT